jgi:hypothetical protein
MKTKNIAFVLATVFLSVLLISFVSATTTFTINPISLKFTQEDVSKAFTVKNTGNEVVDFVIPSPINIKDGSGNTVTVTLDSGSTFSLNAGASKTFTSTVGPFEVENLDLGVHSETILIDGTGQTSAEKVTKEISFSAQRSFCTVPNEGDLSVKIDDITVKNGFGPEDDEWYATDEIEIEIEVENNGQEDIENVEIEWALLTSDGEEVMDGDEKDFDLDEDDDELITINFKLDPDDLEEGEDDYTFFVRGTGEIKDGPNEGEDTCSSDSEEIKLVLDDDFVVLDNIRAQGPVQCGSSLTINADVWNIGDDDQDDVSVVIEVPLLNIFKQVELGDIDSFEDKKLSESITIPGNADEGRYEIQYTVLDEDGDVFENDEDDESIFKTAFEVSGGCGSSTPSVSVSASLNSEAKAGSELTVKASIQNNAGGLVTYEIDSSGHNSWGSLTSVEPALIVLGDNERNDNILFTFNVNEDADGEQGFTIEVKSDGQLIASQPVSFTIGEGSGSSGGLGTITGGAIVDNDNWYLWGIGALNVILVIIIIVVAIRIARS